MASAGGFMLMPHTYAYELFSWGRSFSTLVESVGRQREKCDRAMGFRATGFLFHSVISTMSQGPAGYLLVLGPPKTAGSRRKSGHVL